LGTAVSQKLLVIRFGSIGDVALATQAVDAIYQMDPQLSVDFVTKEHHADYVAQHDAIRTCYPLSASGGWWVLWSLCREIREQRYDVVIDLQWSLRSLIVSLVCRAGRRVSVVTDRMGRWRRIWGRSSHDEFPVFERFLSAFRQAGLVAVTHRRCQRVKPPTDRVREWISQHLNGSPVTVALAIGAQWRSKRWPLVRYEQLAGELLCHGVSRILVVGGTDVTRDAEQIAGRDERITNAAGRFSIGETEVLLSHAQVVVSNDSAVTHLASGVGCGVVVIYGPTTPGFGFRPVLAPHRIIERQIWCRPCTRHGSHVCPLGHHACMERILVSEVLCETLDLLQEVYRLGTVYLDRDGVLIEDRGYLDDLDRLRLTKGAATAVGRLNRARYRVEVVSNQSGIGRGLIAEQRVRLIHQRVDEMLQAAGGKIDRWNICPHRPRELGGGCGCRKPAPGLIQSRCRDGDHRWVVGDRVTDIELGRRIGARTILIEPDVSVAPRFDASAVLPDYRVHNLTEAVEQILKENEGDPDGKWQGTR